jgi:predicted MFS family arabinose efflux permease
MTKSTITLLRVFLPFACGYFISYLFRVVNAVIAPNLVSDTGADPSELGLLTAAYFLTFAAAQLPLGVLLDRYGPRKIESFLLIFAAAGALIFSMAGSITGLVIGRAFIGFGVSACLMAAFKAFVMWFKRDQLPLINGLQMAAGGLGALAATAPVEAVLGLTDWRGVFVGLAILTILVAGLVFTVVPEREPVTQAESFGHQIRGVAEVFTSLTFWRIAPVATVSQASFLSIHGLWSGPWLRDIAGLDRAQTANTLLLVAIAMIAGFIGLGAAAERLSKIGVRPVVVAMSGMVLFMVVLFFILLGSSDRVLPLWLLFGFFGTSGILPYAVLSQSFRPELSGRVNTALNLLVFVFAFIAQWGIGSVIEMWPTTASGGYSPAGYRAAFIVIIVLHIITLIWFFIAGRRLKYVHP